MNAPTISIIIPVKNGIATIRQCLDAIYRQTLIDQTEVIIIDSGSTDGTLEILKQFPVRLYKILPETFNHGATRNYGVALAKGEYVVMTVQDAIPVHRTWLENFIYHFKNKIIQAVVGIQCVDEDHKNNPAVWFKRYSHPTLEIRDIQADAFIRLTKKQQFALCNWDNVNAAYRKSALMEIPFKTTNYSEDWLWAKSALLKGFTIARDPSILVYHYHHHTFAYNFRAKLIAKYIDFKGFSYTPPITFPIIGLLSKIKRIWKYTTISTVKKIYWTNHNIGIFTSTLLAEIVMHTALIISWKKEPIWLYKLFFNNDIPQGISNDTNK
ncbi:MAG: glycosyltransferase family 2 protein [Marinilabiliaceae bacterium]|nr:glycosyltransferase family 2 protein [Marinilabiliaceae bacterium]